MTKTKKPVKPSTRAKRIVQPEQLNKHDAASLFAQLEDLIRNWIDSGKLQPGDRLPSEFELSARFKISRMTTRRALDRLVLEGMIVRKAGKGAFVSKDKLAFNPTTSFSFGTVMRALGHVVRTRVIEQRIVPAPHDAAQGLQLPEGQPIILISRLRHVDGQPAALAKSYLPIQYFEGILKEDLTELPLSRTMEKVSGLTIVRSDDTFEAALARSDEAALLGVSEGAPTLLVRGVAFTQAGLAVRFTKSVYRGDLFRFQLSDSGFSVRFTP
jgi:GntR family transcriptional regulator